MNSDNKQYGVPAFLKWAGGKSQLLIQSRRYFPREIKAYFEPFLGSAAVFFYIKSKYNPEKVLLSDNNQELISCFKMVRSKPFKLIELLKIHKARH